MKKISGIVLALGIAMSPAAPSFAQSTSAAPAGAQVYSTSTTELGTLLDNPATKAVLEKYIPNLLASPQIDQGRSMTLKDAQSYVPDQLTNETLAKIDADLAKIPVQK